MTKQLTLHDLGDERRVLDEFLVETEGEETPEIADLLGQLHGNMVTKLQNCGLYLRELEAEHEATKLEALRLTLRAKATEDRIYRFKAYLTREMIAQNFPLARTPLITVALQLNNPKLVADPSEDLLRVWYRDSEYHHFVRHTPEQFELNRAAFLAFAKENPQKVPQGFSVVREQSVRIR
jgi:hypothetical protein